MEERKRGRVEIVLTHPFDKVKSKGWGTGESILCGSDPISQALNDAFAPSSISSCVGVLKAWPTDHLWPKGSRN